MTSTKCRGWVTGTTVDTWQKKRSFFNDLSRQHLVGGFNPPNKLFVIGDHPRISGYEKSETYPPTRHFQDQIRFWHAMGYAPRTRQLLLPSSLKHQRSMPCGTGTLVSKLIILRMIIKEPWATPKIGLLLKVAILSKKISKIPGGGKKQRQKTKQSSDSKKLKMII